MTITMYEAAVPTFRRYLRQMDAMLALAEAHDDPQDLLQARLAPAMYPFATQVRIAANFALRACAPLSGSAPPPEEAGSDGYLGLHDRLRAVLAYLDALTPAQFEGSAMREFTDQAGHASVTLPGRAFLLEYALPNFLFHVTSAYAILRQAGVAIGKADFDGFHLYALKTAA